MSQEIQLLLASLLGDREVIAYRPALARALGSPLAALYLCQAAYWQSVAGIGEWWYKLRDADRDSRGIMVPPMNRSRQSWEWETGMGRADQENARRLLRDHGLLEERRAGVPARLYYRVNLPGLQQFLLANQQMAESRHPDGEIQPSGQQDMTVKSGQIAPTNSENIAGSKYSKTTTTTPAPPARRRSSAKADSFESLVIETSIAALSSQLLHILQHGQVTDPALAQDLLDELAGASEAGQRGDRPKIGSPTDWLRRLIDRSRAGTFDRNHCLVIQARRAARTREAQQRAIEESPADPEIAREHLARIRAAMSKQQPSPHIVGENHGEQQR